MDYPLHRWSDIDHERRMLNQQIYNKMTLNLDYETQDFFK